MGTTADGGLTVSGSPTRAPQKQKQFGFPGGRYGGTRSRNLAMSLLNRRHAVLVSAIAFAALALPPLPSQAGGQRHPERVRPLSAELRKKPQRVKTTLASAEQRAKKTGSPKCSPDCSELLRKTREQGSLAIIVWLDIPDLPDETKVHDAPVEVKHRLREARRQAIGDTQERLLKRLSRFNVTHVVKLDYIEGMAMLVDATALEVLVDDPEVSGIGEHVPGHPMLRQSVPLTGVDEFQLVTGVTGTG